jgi:hypothetical protein
MNKAALARGAMRPRMSGIGVPAPQADGAPAVTSSSSAAHELQDVDQRDNGSFTEPEYADRCPDRPRAAARDILSKADTLLKPQGNTVSANEARDLIADLMDRYNPGGTP